MTGIANRRAFDEALNEEWRRMLRHGTALSLLMIDVDYFKRFNDAYGHVAGDQCLRTVAQAVASRARRAGELAARYGGEEFAVLLPQTGIGEACKLAEMICAAVRDCQIPHEQSGAAPHVTISVGVASIGKYPDAAAAFSREGARRRRLRPARPSWSRRRTMRCTGPRWREETGWPSRRERRGEPPPNLRSRVDALRT